MRVEELDYRELLELDADGGTIRFAGQRAILLDAFSMGILRKYLVENFGFAAARTLLTQFGFAHGWRMAEAMKAEFTWESDHDLRCAGTRINAMEGLFRAGEGSLDPLAKEGLVLVASYEAEQHALHFGPCGGPVCWTLCGLISGFLSRVSGQEIFVLEDACRGKGDDQCHLHSRTREAWGDERAEELRYFEADSLAESLDISLQRVVDSLKKAERQLSARRRALVQVSPEMDEPLRGIIVRSTAMRHLVDLARRASKVDSTLLITGESGVGKERIARFVHEESMRHAGPFVAVNCGAIAENLLESELFGHARGSFTGAVQDRPGLFEAAQGGTLLLDEVWEVSQGMQTKLLRAIQEREIRRVGENHDRKVDVRIIAATNKDLAQGVADGSFRQDLYYRLKVVELHVPPLRERREDILPLARALLASAAGWMNRPISGFAPGVADLLLRHDWPGNVRELENAMERAAALAPRGRVEVEDLPEEIRSASAKPMAATEGVRRLEDVQKDYLLAALELNGGNQTRTAEQLGIGVTTLYRRLRDFGMIANPRSSQRKGGAPSN